MNNPKARSATASAMGSPIAVAGRCGLREGSSRTAACTMRPSIFGLPREKPARSARSATALTRRGTPRDAR